MYNYIAYYTYKIKKKITKVNEKDYNTRSTN